MQIFSGLLDHHGYETAHFVGHDWGSLVVWEMALRHPERVRSVTVRLVASARAGRGGTREGDA